MKKCPSCGTEVSDNVAFCKRCGTKMTIAEHMKCNFCNREIDDDSAFCSFCGAKVAPGSRPDDRSAEEPEAAFSASPGEQADMPGAESAVSFEELDAEQVPATDIVFECPHCGKSLSIDPLGAGIVITCTQCGQAVTVPVPDGMDISAIDGPTTESPAETEPRHEAAVPVSDVIQYRVPFGEAVRRWFHTFRLSGFSGRGRESRSEYWCGYAFLVAVYFGLVVSSFGLLALSGLGDGLRMPGRAFALFLGYIGAIHAIRRTHDSGRSGWWLLVPVYGFVLLFLPSQKAENRFGPVPNTAPAVSPRRWKTIARMVIAASAILYVGFSAKTVAVSRRWTQATVRGQTIALMVSIENRDRESQNARTLWQVSGAATADDYFAALRDAGVDGLPDDTSGWHVLAGPAGLPGETPFLVSANLGLTTEDLSAYAPLVPNDLGDRLDKSVRPFGRDAVCVVSRAGEVRMLPAAHGLATDSAMFGFLPAAVVRQLAVLPATLDSRPNGKPARTAPTSEDKDGSAEGDEPAADGDARIAVEPTDEGEADTDEDEAGTTDDVVDTARTFIEAFVENDRETFSRIFMGANAAHNTPGEEKAVLFETMRETFGGDPWCFDPDTSEIVSFDKLDPAKAFEELMVEGNFADWKHALKKKGFSELAFVLFVSRDWSGESHFGPLPFFKPENGAWQFFSGLTIDEKKERSLKEVADFYRKLPETKLREECAMFRDMSGMASLDDALREKLAGQLLFRDICRANGVPDEALKESFASGGLDVDGFAKSIASRSDRLQDITNALEKCFSLVNEETWKRHELTIRTILQTLGDNDESAYSLDECGPHRFSGDHWESFDKDKAQVEVLALEAREIKRILISLDDGSRILPDETLFGETPDSSVDYAERLVAATNPDGVAAKWIRELGKWSIAWNIPSNAPDSLAALVSPGFSCTELTSDAGRLEEEVEVSAPLVCIGLNGNIRMTRPRKTTLGKISGMRGTEMVSLRYLAPEGVVTPKRNLQREESAKWNWEQRLAPALERSFADALNAFSEFGGFRLLGAPAKNAAFSGFRHDLQQDVPLPFKYRRFETADLTYFHGALIDIVLKVHFPPTIRQSSIDKEFETLKMKFAERMAALDRKSQESAEGTKHRLEIKDSGGSTWWSVGLKDATPPSPSIVVSLDVQREGGGAGYALSMHISTGGLKELINAVLARADYEDGDDLPELEEDAARTSDGNNLPNLETEAGKKPEQRPSVSPELRKGFKRMSAALETVKSVPSFKNVLAMETVWDSLPEDGRAMLQEPVWSASCAWLLSSGNRSAVVERKTKLDWEAFWPSVSDVCSRCKGTGRMDKDKNCFKCLGLGRTVSNGEDGKCMTVFRQHVESALRICRGD